MSAHASYAALWTKSHFSFLEGASSPGELIEEAHRLGIRALALTDRNGVYGAVRAHVAARELDYPLIIGSEVTLESGEHLILLAESRSGYANLCRVITAGRLKSSKGFCSLSLDEVCAHAEGLIALWPGQTAGGGV
jgi:error-prone DNA polymerase